jgi:hypothetical protein
LDAVGLDGAAEQLARAEDVRLPGQFVEVSRSHARGERLVPGRFQRGRGVRPGFSRGCKQVIARHEGRLAPGEKIAQNKKARRPAGFGFT